VVNQIEVLPKKQEVNQVGAASKIEKLSCPWDDSSQIGKYACLAFRAPYTTLTFLFRPLLFVDTTSASSILAGVENFFWISMFGLIAVSIFKRRRVDFIEEIAPSLIFFILYTVGAGAYEGNLGTAFRHKAIILWIVLILIFAVSVNSNDRQKKPKS
jgi:TctA family transporter